MNRDAEDRFFRTAPEVAEALNAAALPEAALPSSPPSR
jgi:hypothetical protein